MWSTQYKLRKNKLVFVLTAILTAGGIVAHSLSLYESAGRVCQAMGSQGFSRAVLTWRLYQLAFTVLVGWIMWVPWAVPCYWMYAALREAGRLRLTSEGIILVGKESCENVAWSEIISSGYRQPQGLMQRFLYYGNARLWQGLCGGAFLSTSAGTEVYIPYGMTKGYDRVVSVVEDAIKAGKTSPASIEEKLQSLAEEGVIGRIGEKHATRTSTTVCRNTQLPGRSSDIDMDEIKHIIVRIMQLILFFGFFCLAIRFGFWAYRKLGWLPGTVAVFVLVSVLLLYRIFRRRAKKLPNTKLQDVDDSDEDELSGTRGTQEQV